MADGTYFVASWNGILHRPQRSASGSTSASQTGHHAVASAVLAPPASLKVVESSRGARTLGSEVSRPGADSSGSSSVRNSSESKFYGHVPRIPKISKIPRPVLVASASRTPAAESIFHSARKPRSREATETRANFAHSRILPDQREAI
jgi:hypothetical protein